MTSFQSTLAEDEGIAEELAASQRSISIAEFFEKNKHMLGFDSGARGLVTAVKEAVDNALDATEEAGIKPDISVEIADQGDYYRLVVEDNGPGITKEQIPKVFGKLLYGSRFHAREQSRGQQGIGISAAVLYSQLTSGKPAKVTSRTAGHDQAQYFELVIDTDTNEPEIRHEEALTAADSDLNPTTGTRIELEMEANMRARNQLRDYIKHTAVVNPHARIRLKEPGLEGWQQFDRVEGADLPRETSEIQPHPHGVELGTLLKMLGATDSRTLSGFLQTEFTRVGRKTATNVLDAFRDRHFGREMAWQAPTDLETDLDARIADAVANKGKAATSQFAEEIAGVLRERDRTAHHELREIVANVAETVGEETGKHFGETVQENAVAAAWDALTADLAADLYPLVDDATSTRKDDATVRGLAERIGEKFTDADDERHRATHDTVVEYVDNAADRVAEYEDATVGDTARENIVDAIWSRMCTVPDDPPSASTVADDRDAASELLEAMRETDIISPPTDCLSPITSELVEAGLKKEFDAEFYAASTRDAEVHGGDPFVVEAGIAYGGELEESGSVDLLRFANRVPLVYQRGACATTDVVKRIGWRNYGLSQPGGSGMPQGPAVIMIHVASTNVPFTSESKDAIANVPAIEDEIELAVREAARELKSHINKRKSMQKRQQKQNVLGEILPEMADKLSEVTGKERPDISGAMARIMNNVSVEREVRDGEVTLIVENHSDRNESVEITDIVNREVALNGTGESFEMDGEWYVRWHPEVPAGETMELTYETDDDAEFDISVSGVEQQKLTVNA